LDSDGQFTGAFVGCAVNDNDPPVWICLIILHHLPNFWDKLVVFWKIYLEMLFYTNLWLRLKVVPKTVESFMRGPFEVVEQP